MGGCEGVYPERAGGTLGGDRGHPEGHGDRWGSPKGSGGERKEGREASNGIGVQRDEL